MTKVWCQNHQTRWELLLKRPPKFSTLIESYLIHPNELIVKYPNASRRTLRRGNDYVSDITKRVTRLIRGQPEGYIEAFANIYIEAARAIEAETSGQRIPESCDFPRVEDGVAGMAFVDAAVESAKNGGVWTKMKHLQ